MMDDKLNLYTKDELLCLGIYELRDLGRDIGVKSPTTLKKEELVDKIVSIIYGEVPKSNIGKGRGRPVRAKDKPNRIYVDLIDKIEAPKCDKSFIFSDDQVVDIKFVEDLISSRVASSSSQYVNDSQTSNEGFLKNGVVCDEDGKFVVRKFRFIKSDNETCIPDYIVSDYSLKDNDIIDYIVNEEKNLVVQLFKINGNYPVKSVRNKEDKETEKKIFIDDKEIALYCSNLINISTVQDRINAVDKFCEKVNDLNFNYVKVCFDRNSMAKKEVENYKNQEIFASCVGDEFETIAMVETGIEKALFSSALEGKSVLVLDNLSWLISVISTYPENLYGNFVEKMVKTCKNSNITLVCFSGYLSNEKVSELKSIFDNIN